MLFFLLLAILLIWTENKSICHIEKKTRLSFVKYYSNGEVI